VFETLIFIGNLGGDPELRYIPNGQDVCKFIVAYNREYKTADGQKAKETTWFRVSVWGKQAESTAQYLHKGSRVLIEGRLSPDPETGNPRIWERNDGTPQAAYEVTASTVRYLDKSEPRSDGLPEATEELPF
jgi:single-strand DNA-binding protein